MSACDVRSRSRQLRPNLHIYFSPEISGEMGA